MNLLFALSCDSLCSVFGIRVRADEHRRSSRRTCGILQEIVKLLAPELNAGVGDAPALEDLLDLGGIVVEETTQVQILRY